MTIVKATLETKAGVLVTARLLGENWTHSHTEYVSTPSDTSDVNGSWELDLPAQSTFAQAGTVWLIEHAYRRRLVVVPDGAGPFFVDDIEVSSPAYPSPGAPSVYLTRDELGQPEGPASLGADGKVPAAQLPAGSGGDPADATTTSKGVVQLSGDLSGTATNPTVPGLAAIAAKYTKPGGGIPSTDLTAAVQASLAAGDAAVTDAELVAGLALKADTTTVNAALALKADAAATTAALAGKQPAGDYATNGALTSGLAAKAAKPRVVAAYVTTGTGSGDVPPSTGSAWTKYAGVGELVVPAAVGDFLAIDLACVIVADSGSLWDLGVLVGSSITWTSSSGTAVPSGDGDPGLAPFAAPVRPFMSAGGWLVVEAGHLDGGNVRFVLLSNSGGGGKIFHAATNPFRWKAENRGPVL